MTRGRMFYLRHSAKNKREGIKFNPTAKEKVTVVRETLTIVNRNTYPGDPLELTEMTRESLNTLRWREKKQQNIKNESIKLEKSDPIVPHHEAVECNQNDILGKRNRIKKEIKESHNNAKNKKFFPNPNLTIKQEDMNDLTTQDLLTNPYTNKSKVPLFFNNLKETNSKNDLCTRELYKFY